MKIRVPLHLIFRPLPLVKSETCELQPHLEAALAWIKRAHAVVGCNGISKGYDILRGCWSPAYPETTGYTIPTLLNAATLLDRPELAAIAECLADYLLKQSTPEGGVGHWKDHSRARPIVFDTGQVIFGWLAAYRSTGDRRFFSAAQQAGDWLVSSQDISGAWVNFQYNNVIKTIDSRVAWALLELYRCVPEDRYFEAARKNLDWVCQQQDPNGWFHHCSFVPGQDPYTHTIAYTAEGLLESGLRIGDEKYIVAARKTIDALLARQGGDGSLPGSHARNWEGGGWYSCLTGNCQLALLALKANELTNKEEYFRAAEKAIEYASRTQIISSELPCSQDLYGGIAGSAPIFGAYERLKMPNWAVKFYVDALLRLTFLHSTNMPIYHPG